MRTRTLAVIACFGSFAAASATADIINYGDFVGNDVTFYNVSEFSGTDPVPLYNEPGVFGNSLNFDPTMTAFTGGGGVDLTDGQVNMVIGSNNGAPIVGLNLLESGDTTIFGFGGAATTTAVGATFFIEILEVDGVSIDPIQGIFSMTFSPSGGTFNLADDGQLLVAPWTGSLFIDIAAMLAAHNVSGDATSVGIAFNNTLVASSEIGSVAFIAKKDLMIGVVIPAPGALCLLIAGFCCSSPSRRRRA